MDAKQAIPYMSCTQGGNNDMFRNIPEEANIPIPVSPEEMMMMMMMMHGHGPHTGKIYSLPGIASKTVHFIVLQNNVYNDLSGDIRCLDNSNVLQTFIYDSLRYRCAGVKYSMCLWNWRVCQSLFILFFK